MFCHKCGTEIAEGAEFCHKCGTKVVTVAMEPASMPVVSESAPVQGPRQTPAPSVAIDDTNEFRAFVDNHVKATTKFQSAEELLNSKVSINFVWICLGTATILGILTLNPIILAFTVFLGYLIANIISGVKRGRCSFKFQGKITNNNLSEEMLLHFLNSTFKTVFPLFQEWGRIRRVGSGIRGRALNAAVSLPVNSIGEISLCSLFGGNQLPVIYIRPDAVGSTQMEYSFGAENPVTDDKPFTAKNTGMDFTFLRYKCLVKTAPILQATMEYYLKYYNTPQGGNENVLH